MGFPMCHFPLKIFEREQDIRENNTVNEVNKTTQTLTGDLAREFYESIINEESTAELNAPVNCKKIKTKSVLTNHTFQKFEVKDIWKFAQNNDYVALGTLLKDDKDINVNCNDVFGWTPLMCAACSGAKECVEILINHKADLNIRDKSGRTASMLAAKNNFLHIVNMLKNENNQMSKSEYVIKRKSKGKIFCKTCNSVFHTHLKKHECSTLHLFNNPGQTKTFYGIPESNKGFQMLLKNGWDKGKGLGPNEHGIRFPIKAKMKNDRIGFGGAIPKVKSESSNVRKEQICKTEKDWKNFERSFKLEFS